MCDVAEGSVTATQIVGVAPASGAVEILMPGATEAVDHVEGQRTISKRHPRRGSIEAEHAQGLPESWDEYPLGGNPALACGFSGDHCHIFADAGELVRNLPRCVLDPANAWSETLDHDRDAQMKSSRWFGANSATAEPQVIPWPWLRHRACGWGFGTQARRPVGSPELNCISGWRPRDSVRRIRRAAIGGSGGHRGQPKRVVSFMVQPTLPGSWNCDVAWSLEAEDSNAASLATTITTGRRPC